MNMQNSTGETHQEHRNINPNGESFEHRIKSGRLVKPVKRY